MSEKILDEHRQRGAAIYIRQSTMTQVLKNRESQKRRTRSRSELPSSDLSEFELSISQQGSFEAIRAKARRGELQFILPVFGFCWTQAGKVELDPDRRVQEAIRLVFRKFDALGSFQRAQGGPGRGPDPASVL